MTACSRGPRTTTAVEFGTSFGISTVHLAAALADNDGGHLFTTEMSPVKIAAAQA